MPLYGHAHPSADLVGEVNKINSVNGIFLDHNDPQHPFTASTPDEDSISFPTVSGGNLVNVRKAVLAELFGPTIKTIWEASISSVQLPRHPVKVLTEKRRNCSQQNISPFQRSTSATTQPCQNRF
ncbi:hypothetical protein PHMEG_00011052 [Phytophthora megakarya]|uniref:Uncharacterized protein n=1 Tax=Phytophthora megakarya TaxID=4795 RepID=A0A225WCH4_9STRA|nr:hypothetical protein PHMEG_00011052 [Phytophthora megakarya]